MNRPLVTVVTPSYNQGRFIRATIESVLSQDYPDIEYIIMDGGSRDETASVAAEYSSRLTFISERDRGQSHAINKGFRKARGEIVSWINSDDVILPGAVSHAVRAFERNPKLGAVYGEGYQIDVDGNVKTRFLATEPFNLWKLIYLSDFILQQTAYFRKAVLDDVGYVNENLNWCMDWDLFVRIGKKYDMEYIPEYMGSIREYPAAKSFAGGGKRFRELARLMRSQGTMRYPPGYWTYGLDTYGSMLTNCLREKSPVILGASTQRARSTIQTFAQRIIGRILLNAQGLYSDGWVAPKMHYMLRQGSGAIEVSGMSPGFPNLVGQRLQILAGGVEIANRELPAGEFQFMIEAPPEFARESPTFLLKASKWVVPREAGISPDDRRLAYMLKRFDWASSTG